MKTFWKTPMIDGERIREHYGHDIVVASYGGGQHYSLECNDCYEVIMDSDVSPTAHNMLKFLYQKQGEGYEIGFDREGGYYGWLCYSDDENSYRVNRSRTLI